MITYKTRANVWLELAVRRSSITTLRGWFPLRIFLPVKSPAMRTAALPTLFYSTWSACVAPEQPLGYKPNAGREARCGERRRRNLTSAWRAFVWNAFMGVRVPDEKPGPEVSHTGSCSSSFVFAYEYSAGVH